MLSPSEFVKVHFKKLDSYIIGITGGTIIANKYEKLAVTRFLNFKKKYTYQEDKLIPVLRFFSLLNVPIGNDIRQVEILPHQVFWLANFYCLFDHNGNRLFTTAYIETAKKSGKSTFSSCLSIFESIGNCVLNSHTLILAGSREQARTNLNFCNTIIESSPLISSYFLINKNIIYNKTDTGLNKIEIRASEASKIHGVGNGMSLSVIDEYAFHKNSSLKNAIKTAQMVMGSHLQLIFTTASNERQSPAFQLRATCVNILDGIIDDDSLFTQIFTLDDNSEIGNPEVWRKANPSIGYITTLDAMVKDYNSAKIFPDKLNSFLIFNLNIWIENLAEKWIADDLIKDQLKDNKQIPLGADVYLGYDGSSTRDLTSISIIYFDPLTDTFITKILYVFPDNPTKKIRQGSIDLTIWLQEGHIIQNPLPVIDDDFIIEIFKDLKSKFNIISIGYDAFNSRGLFQKIERELDLPCSIVSQKITSLNYPIRFLESLILKKKIFFDRNPVTRWNFQNVVTYHDSNNNVKLMKNKSEAIDGIIATVCALYEWLALNEGSMNFLLDDLKTLYSKKDK